MKLLHHYRAVTAVAVAVATGISMLGVSLPSAFAAKQKAKTPIVIGATATLSGPLAPQSYGSNQYFMAYIDYLNAHGGIEGHHVKVVMLDDKGDPGQALLDFETLWSSDHVSLIVTLSGQTTPPFGYIKKHDIPVFTYQGDQRQFSSYYPSIITDGDNLGEVGGEVAYWLTKVAKKHPKVVAVQLVQQYSTWDNFLVNNWKKDGAKTVDLEPDNGPNADCTALILRFKAEGVQYFDMEGTEAPACILAEQRLGWKPPMGQGGALTSQIGEAELIGKPYAGVVAGSPNTLYTGAPIYSHPTQVDKTYVANVKKYVPAKLDNYAYLNGTNTIIGYSMAMLATYDVQGSLAKYGNAHAKDLLKYAQGVKNYNNELQPPVRSFAPNCKTGSDGTIWGYWHYNAHPTKFKPSIYLVPTSGPKWITGKDLGLPNCVLTQQIDKAYPHG